MEQYKGPIHIEESSDGEWKIVKGEDPAMKEREELDARPTQVGDTVVIGPHNNRQNTPCMEVHGELINVDPVNNRGYATCFQGCGFGEEVTLSEVTKVP